MTRKNFDPGPLADVSARSGKGEARVTLVLTRDIRHPRERVWAALTEPDALSQWAPFIPDRSLAAAGPAVLKMTEGDETEEFPAQVLLAEPPARLEYLWGEDLLVWELEPAAAGTRLTLRHTVESLPWVPKVAAGWHICLAVAELWLDGKPVGPIIGGEAKEYGWERLHDAYAQGLNNSGFGKFSLSKIGLPDD